MHSRIQEQRKQIRDKDPLREFIMRNKSTIAEVKPNMGSGISMDESLPEIMQSLYKGRAECG